jgi:MFS family permease
MESSDPALSTTPDTAPPMPSEPPAPETTEAAHRSALLIVFLVVFIDLLGWGIVLPLLPRFAKEFLPADVSPLIRGVTIGLLMSSFSAMQFFLAPVWGRLSDQVGRRPVLLLGLAASAVFNALFGFASMMGSEGNRELGLILLFVARIGAGVAGATLGTAQAVIADSTAPERRARGMALIGAAFGIGFTFGPLIGAGALWLAPEVKSGPGIAAAVLSLGAFVLGFMLMPETLRTGAAGRPRHWFHLEGFRLAWSMPKVALLILIFFVSVFAFAFFEATLALLTALPGLGLDEQKNFLMFAYVGLSLALAQGLLYRRLALRVSELTFMRVGALLMILGLVGLGSVAYLASSQESSQAGWLMGGFMVLLTVGVTGFAFMTPSVQSLVSRWSDPTRQGEILGVNQSINALARILGPFTGLLLFHIPRTSHTVPYIVSSVLLLVVLGLTLRLRQE